MNKLISVAQILLPIFAAPALGIYARKKQLLTPEENNGLQAFVLKFGMPCILFNSTLSASLQAESLTSMLLLLPFIFLMALAGFALGKKKIPLHNLPQLMCAKESGMLGIPLYMTLFGAGEAYRMGVLDLTQAIVVIPVIGILSAAPGEDPGIRKLAGKVLRSPFLIMSALGLALNLSGLRDFLADIQVLGLITGVTGFLGEPVSAVMLFSAGYSFSLTRENRGRVFRISALHYGCFALICGAIQLLLCLAPEIGAATRWAVVLYCALAPSYLAPSLGRTQEETATAAGVCSVLTVVNLLVFCVMAVLLA